MENPEKDIVRKFTQEHIQMKSSQTEQINKFIEIHEDGKLTQQIIQNWLNSLPKNEREDAKYNLECGISTNIEDIP